MKNRMKKSLCIFSILLFLLSVPVHAIHGNVNDNFSKQKGTKDISVSEDVQKDALQFLNFGMEI
jgi:hypothetical protein